MLLKVNYFASDKGKSLHCRVFIEAKMGLLCMYLNSHNLFSNDFVHSL